MNLDSIKALIFDFDGTLADTLELRLRSWKQVFQDIGIIASDVELRHLFMHGKDDPEIIRTVSAGHPNADNLDVEGLLQARANLRTQYVSEIRLFDDVMQTVDELCERGYRLAVCSGTSEIVMRDVLRQAGVLQQFAVVIGAESTPYRKPDKRILEAVAEGLSLDVQEAVFLGDTLADETMAERAAMPFIGVNRKDSGVLFKTDKTVAGLSEVIELFKKK